MYARVFGFHVERRQSSSVREALDVALVRCRRNEGFRGLLCLEHEGLHEQVLLITLWESMDLAATAPEAEYVRELIEDAVDMGVSSRTYDVLGFIRGTDPAPREAIVA